VVYLCVVCVFDGVCGLWCVCDMLVCVVMCVCVVFVCVVYVCVVCVSICGAWCGCV